MPKKKNTAILMATYNGEDFIEKQIDSLLLQSYQYWHLYIHDDGSHDNTINIIKCYTDSYAEKITLLDYPPQGGACRNFLSLLEQVDADYFLFCDQDDIWLHEKVETEMIRMKQLEMDYPEKPIVVFSDLEVVNSSMEVISPSMWNAIGICPKMVNGFTKGGVHEYVTGCTMLFNRKAKEETLRHSAQKAIMHDVWVTLCVLKAHGVASGIEKPLVRYRQHDTNTLGASSQEILSLRYKLHNIRHILRHDIAHWQMLQSLGYGSFGKFLYYKYIYRHFHLHR